MLHDATVRKTTYRIATKNHDFALIIQSGIKDLGAKAWIYKEGKNRNLWIVEFSKTLLAKAKIKSQKDRIDFVRGFFDAEGGIARDPKVRFYLYFCQKDFKILAKIKEYLSEIGITSGKIHNPSKKVDPDYWRFFANVKSHRDFARMVFSNHPEKLVILRMKI